MISGFRKLPIYVAVYMKPSARLRESAGALFSTKLVSSGIRKPPLKPDRPTPTAVTPDQTCPTCSS